MENQENPVEMSGVHEAPGRANAELGAGAMPPADELERMKPERIQGPAAITMTWTVPGKGLDAAALLAMAQPKAVATDPPAFLQVRQKVQYRLFASVRSFFSRLIARVLPAEKPILVELQVLADPGKATEAADLIKTLTRLANGQA